MASNFPELAASSIEISTGVDDTHQGLKLGVDGDPFWRVHLTPQGEVLMGDGTATPTSLESRVVAVEDTPALHKLAESILDANAASIDITGIPADYKDLIVELSLRSTAAATFDTVLVAVNNDTTDANYRSQMVQHSNATISAAQNIGAANVRGQVFATGASSVANDFGVTRLVIPDYANAGKTKVLHLDNEVMLTRSSGGLLVRSGFLSWLSTSVINRLTFTGSANWLAGSRVSIYGRRSANPL